MNYKLKEKIAIGYTCCGESYRRSLKEKLENVYFDNNKIYYCVVTDDKKYFEGIKRKNLIVNELKDFYDEYPLLEKYEAFLESDTEEEYAEKFLSTDYRFPFSTFRFNLLQAWKLGIQNVSMICTDTHFNFDVFNNSFFKQKGKLWNAISEWDEDIEKWNMGLVADIIEENLGLNVDNTIRILDAAGRLYIADNLDSVKKLFDTMNTVIEKMYEKDYMKLFYGPYARNDEYIMGPIYNALGITQGKIHSYMNNQNRGLFTVKHGMLRERYFKISSDGSIKDHTNYKEFLRINKLEYGKY